MERRQPLQARASKLFQAVARPKCVSVFFHFALRVASQGSGFVARKEFTAEGDSGSVGAETDPLAV